MLMKGDYVQVRSDLVVGNVYGDMLFRPDMRPYAGVCARVTETCYEPGVNLCQLHVSDRIWWSEEMLEPQTDRLNGYLLCTHSSAGTMGSKSSYFQEGYVYAVHHGVFANLKDEPEFRKTLFHSMADVEAFFGPDVTFVQVKGVVDA